MYFATLNGNSLTSYLECFKQWLLDHPYGARSVVFFRLQKRYGSLCNDQHTRDLCVMVHRGNYSSTQ